MLRAKKIASNLDIEIKCIVNKYTGAGLSSKFVRSIMNNFDSGKDNLTVCNAKTRLNEHKEVSFYATISMWQGQTWATRKWTSSPPIQVP